MVRVDSSQSTAFQNQNGNKDDPLVAAKIGDDQDKNSSGDTAWLNNFFLIFTTSTQENIRKDVSME